MCALGGVAHRLRWLPLYRIRPFAAEEHGNILKHAHRQLLDAVVTSILTQNKSKFTPARSIPAPIFLIHIFVYGIDEL